MSPGANPQSLINSNPPRTTFCFAAGTYDLSGTIWTGDRFPTLDLRANAVVDGQNGGFVGINGANAPAGQAGIVVLGGTFQHFGNASSPSWVAPIILPRGGRIDGTEFKQNFNAGVGVQGTNARVSNAHIHHNGQYGLVVTPSCIGCPGPTDVIIENSEIAFNNTRHLPTGNEAGGTKFVATKGMVVRGNEVHDNYGAGLWWDGYNTDAHVYGNVIYDNRNWGIFWELSYGGVKIHDNTLTGNGIGDGSPNFFNNVQLLVSCSDGSVGGIEIYENTIDGKANPLGLINHSGHPIRTKHVYVHHNVMILRSSTSKVGAIAFDGLAELYSADNRFDHNVYRVRERDGAYWTWNEEALTWSQWQALGHDANGTRKIKG